MSKRFIIDVDCVGKQLGLRCNDYQVGGLCFSNPFYKHVYKKNIICPGCRLDFIEEVKEE